MKPTKPAKRKYTDILMVLMAIPVIIVLILFSPMLFLAIVQNLFG